MRKYLKPLLLGLASLTIAIIAMWSLGFFRETSCTDFEGGSRADNCLIQNTNLEFTVWIVVLSVAVFGLALILGSVLRYLWGRIFAKSKPLKDKKSITKPLLIMAALYVPCVAVIWMLVSDNSDAVALVFTLAIIVLFAIPFAATSCIIGNAAKTKHKIT